MKEQDKVYTVESDFNPASIPSPSIPEGARTSRSSSGSVIGGLPLKGSGPVDRDGVHPHFEGNATPPAGYLPDKGPPDARGDLEIIQAAALCFCMTTHVATSHATHESPQPPPRPQRNSRAHHTNMGTSGTT